MGIGAVTGAPARAVFLDRDGVLNQAIIRNGKPYPPQDGSECEVVPDAPDSLRRLKAASYRLIVVTNQPDVARGTQSIEAVESINSFLSDRLPLDDFFVCYHDDCDRCECRKPKPGLLLAAAQKHGIDLAQSFLIGDRWRDIDAGASAGCRTVLIDYGYNERSSASPPSARVGSLSQAVNWILSL